METQMTKSSQDISKFLESRVNTHQGIEPKFWIKIGGEDFLYKFFDKDLRIDRPKKEMRIFNEVLVSILCKKLGIDCVDVSFAQAEIDGFDQSKKSTQTKGCLVRSYLKEENSETQSLDDIGDFYCNSKKLNYYELDNPQTASEAICYYAKQKGCVLDDDISDKLKTIALFDYVTAQGDRHGQNIEIITYVKNGYRHLKLAPLFDNGRCFGSVDLERGHVLPRDAQGLFNMNCVINSKSDEFLSTAFGIAYEIMNNKNLKELFNKMQKININQEINDLIEKSGEELSLQARSFIIHIWQTRIEQLELALTKLGDPKIMRTVEDKLNNYERFDYILRNDLLAFDSYLNYRCAKECGNCVSLFEYIKQDEEYRKKLRVWQNLESDDLPKRSQYPLLNQTFSNDLKRDMRIKIDCERERRREFMQRYIHYDMKEKYPQLYASNSENQRIWQIFTLKKLNWIKYGQDYCKMPTVEQAIAIYKNKRQNSNKNVQYDVGREK